MGPLYALRYGVNRARRGDCPLDLPRSILMRKRPAAPVATGAAASRYDRDRTVGIALAERHAPALSNSVLSVVVIWEPGSGAWRAGTSAPSFHRRRAGVLPRAHHPGTLGDAMTIIIAILQAILLVAIALLSFRHHPQDSREDALPHGHEYFPGLLRPGEALEALRGEGGRKQHRLALRRRYSWARSSCSLRVFRLRPRHARCPFSATSSPFCTSWLCRASCLPWPPSTRPVPTRLSAVCASCSWACWLSPRSYWCSSSWPWPRARPTWDLWPRRWPI